MFVQGMINLNRAVDGDTVAIEMLPKSEWSCPSSLVLVDREERQKEEDDIDENVGCCPSGFCCCFCVFFHFGKTILKWSCCHFLWKGWIHKSVLSCVFFKCSFLLLCVCLISLYIVVGLGFVLVDDECDDDNDEDDCDIKPRVLVLHFLKPVT